MKVPKRQLLINAIMSVTQILVISGTLFVLYRFLLDTIGIEQLGIWSLVLAATAVTQIANLGLSVSLVKFVSKYIALKDQQNVSQLIQTAAISTAIFVGLIILIAYPVAALVLKMVVPSKFVPHAMGILPYSLISLWLLILVGVFQSGIDGCQRIDIRSMLLMASAVLYLVLCFVLAPRYGLMGVAYARVIQNLSVLVASWLILRRYVPLLPIIPCRWNKTLFREMFGYGVNFQVISVTSMLGDPITKVLLSKFGGLAMVGYYEMASRMIHQLRALIISANQVVVPTVSGLHEVMPEKVNSFYAKSYQTIFYISLPAYSFLIVCAPLVSRIWLGWYEPVFVFTAVLLSIGAFLNTLGGPAYFTNLGTGSLKWNVIGHLLSVLLNALLGFVLGVIFGGKGVIVSFMIAAALSSGVITVAYSIKHKISLTELLAGKELAVAVFCALAVSFLLNAVLWGGMDVVTLNVYSLMIFMIITAVPMWRHPVRKSLFGWVANDLFAGNKYSAKYKTICSGDKKSVVKDLNHVSEGKIW